MRQIGFSVLLVCVLVLAAPALAQTPTEQPPTGALVVLPEVFERAAAASSAGDYDRAVLDYSLFILFNPTFSQAYFNRALNYEARGDTAQAIQDLSQALSYETTPSAYQSDIYFARASLYLNQNQVEAAINDLDAAIAANPEAVNPLLLHARLMTFLEQYPTARADYDRLIALQPNDPRFYLERGLLNAQMRDFTAALADYDQAIQLAPDQAQPYAERALFHSAQQNYERALADIDRAISLNPDVSRFYLIRGSLRLTVDQPAEAAADYFRWITLNRTQQFVAPEVLTQNRAFTLDMQPGYVYRIPFQADAGQRISAAARDYAQQADPMDPLLVILGVDGSPLIADDDSGGNLAAFIRDYIIPEAGEYTLIVSQAAGGPQSGTVAVRIDLGQ